MNQLICNRCGKLINEASENWGNCTLCGDDLCMECAVGFSDTGECERCVRNQFLGNGE